jgi:hypothetical protein
MDGDVGDSVAVCGLLHNLELLFASLEALDGT